MRRKQVILVSGAALALAVSLAGPSSADSQNVNSPSSVRNTREVRETQRLNRDSLWQAEGYRGRHIRHIASAATSRAKYAESKGIDRTTAKTPGIDRSKINRMASRVGNEIMRAMYTKRAAFTDRELASGIPLKEINNPDQTLSSASVETRDGWVLGEVKSVKTGSNDLPKTVDITTGGFLGFGERVVPIGAKDMTYLKGRNILVTSLSKNEVKALPVVQSKT